MADESITIGLDIDEVLANYLEGFRDYLNDRFYQKELTKAELDLKFPLNTTTYDMGDWEIVGGDRAAFEALHAKAVDEGLYSRLTPVLGAREYVNQMKADDDHIRIITSRFVRKWQHAKVLQDTSMWLDKQGFKYDDIVFTAKKTDIRVDIYIDDSPKNIQSFIEAGKDYIIYDFGYNKNLPGLRAYSWEQVYRMVQEFKTERPLLQAV